MRVRDNCNDFWLIFRTMYAQLVLFYLFCSYCLLLPLCFSRHGFTILQTEQEKNLFAIVIADEFYFFFYSEMKIIECIENKIGNRNQQILSMKSKYFNFHSMNIDCLWINFTFFVHIWLCFVLVFAVLTIYRWWWVV